MNALLVLNHAELCEEGRRSGEGGRALVDLVASKHGRPPSLCFLPTTLAMSYNPHANPYSTPGSAYAPAPVYGAYPAQAGPAYPQAGPSYAGPAYPGAGGAAADPWAGGFDADVAAQQSIYTPEAAKKYQPPAGVDGNKGKARTTVLRKGGGEIWEDPSLMEWDPGQSLSLLWLVARAETLTWVSLASLAAHFRLFIGDLDPALSDDLFVQAFSGVRYPSFVKAKIIRDKYTNKGKGFGFVSYSDPEDFLKAWKEMNGKSVLSASHPRTELTSLSFPAPGKYVGTRPVKISKATAGVSAVNIGNRKAAALDAKKKVKSGTVPYEKSKAAEAESLSGRGGYGPERSRKSYIRR